MDNFNFYPFFLKNGHIQINYLIAFKFTGILYKRKNNGLHNKNVLSISVCLFNFYASKRVRSQTFDEEKTEKKLN